MNPVLEHIRAGRFDAIDRWLTDRHHASCDANAFLLDAILSLLGDREDIILEKLHASFPDESAFRYLTLYGLASKTALMGDLENTVRHLREAARFAYLSTGVFFEDPAFCHTGFKIQQQAAYIDCRLPGNAPDESLAKIDWRGCSEGNVNLVLLAAANGVYMEHFAETFLRSLDAVDWPEGTVVHLHVSNPPDDQKNLFSGLSNVSPIALCISTDSIGDVPAVVFACRRFIIAAAVMERYRADIITLDIDSIAQEPLGRVPGAMEGADIGLFEGMLGVEPQLICSCAMVFFRNTPAAHCFLRPFRLIFGKGSWRWTPFGLLISAPFSRLRVTSRPTPMTLRGPAAGNRFTGISPRFSEVGLRIISKARSGKGSIRTTFAAIQPPAIWTSRR